MKKLSPVHTAKTEPYRHTITSADLNLRLDSFDLNPAKIKFNGPKGWHIKKWTLHGGKQEDVDIIEVNNGAMRIVICPTRGMGIIGAEIADLRLGWDSPVKEIVHPKFINLLARGGLGWLEGFNEWIVRCGLENAGAPGKDKFRNNVGDEAEMDLTLHGRIANTPASEVEVIVEQTEPYRIYIIGRIFERLLFGPKLELLTEISTEPGSNKFRIQDTVINHSSAKQEFQLLYHINFGSPLLEKGSKFVAPIQTITPINERAAQEIGNFDTYPEAIPGFIEKVYCITPYSDNDNTTMAMLKNGSSSRAILLRYSTAELPCLSLWKCTNTPEEGYVTGIEPATGFPHNRRIERKFGRVPILEPQQMRSFTIEYEACLDSLSVSKAEKNIENIRNNRPTQINKTPPVIE